VQIRDLPVYRHKQEILDALRDSQVIVVQSPTGSGKTTQIPIILFEAGYSASLVIGVTQPRRIATLSVCDYIKASLGVENNLVAYKMRFYDTTDGSTNIKIMTDGILLQEIKADPLLQSYSVIMVDEAHERSLNIDFILGLLKGVLAKRSDFKVIISSATINTQAFSEYFDNAPIISIDTKTFDVDVVYQKVESSDYEEVNTAICDLVEKAMDRGREKCGDILVFLAGEADINLCVKSLYYGRHKKDIDLYPLYGRLSKEDQEKVFRPTKPGKIKVVVATNIAETSITIDGIKTVIDSGMAKMNFYNQDNFTSALVPMPVSKSSCEQRKGRAGRTSPGTCYRLYDEEDFEKRPEFTLEEILRTDLSEVVLRMSELEIYDYEGFPFITKPNAAAIKSAEQTLFLLSAIDKDRHLTKIGELMCSFPLLPRHSRALAEAIFNYPGVVAQVIVAISFLSTRSIFIIPQDKEYEAKRAHQRFACPQGDFVSFLNIFSYYTEKLSDNMERKAWCDKNYLDFQIMSEIYYVNEQLCEIVSSKGIPLLSDGSTEDYLTCMASGLVQFICARCRNRTYKSITAQNIFIHPGSDFFTTTPQYILAAEIVHTRRMFARTVSPLTPKIIEKACPGLMARLKPQKEQEEPARQQASPAAVEKSGMMTLYGVAFQLASKPSGKKKAARVVLIPVDKLGALKAGFEAAGRKAHDVQGTLLVEGKYTLEERSSIKDLLDIYDRVDFSRPIIKDIPALGFSADYPGLASYLELIGKLCILDAKHMRLGWVTLIYDGKSAWSLRCLPDFFDSLQASLYSLIELEERSPYHEKAASVHQSLVQAFS